METSLSENRGIRRDGSRAHTIEGPVANAIQMTFAAGRWLTRPSVWQPLLAGVLATATWLGITRVSFVETGWWVIVASIGAGSCVYSYLRTVFGLSAWFSVPGAAVFLCHPLVRVAGVAEDGDAAFLGTLIIPLALLLAQWWGRASSVSRAICLGGLLGLAAAIDLPGSVLLALVMVALGVLEAIQPETTKQEERSLRRQSSMFILTLVVTLVTCVVLPGVMDGLGLPLQGEPAAEVTDEETVGADGIARGLLSPLALVDRGGGLSARLSNLPEELLSGRQYLGWSLIFLCLVAVWPGVLSCEGAAASFSGLRRRLALLVMLAIAMTWLCRGSVEGMMTSTGAIGSQLKDLFEFATVRRQVDSTSLHYLGLLTIPLVGVVATLFLATASVLKGTSGFTFLGVIAATSAAMCFWRTCPPAFLQDCGDYRFGGWPASPLLNVILTFALVAAGAVGIKRMCGLARTRPWRSLLWVGLLLILTLDMSPLAGNEEALHIQHDREVIPGG